MDKVIELFEKDNFAKNAGVKIIEVKPGYAECIMPITELHLNGLGILMGGALFTLADYTFSLAANSYGNIAVTLNASVSYLQKCSGGVVKAVATEKFRSNKTGLYQVEITDEDNNLIGEVTGTCYFKKHS